MKYNFKYLNGVETTKPIQLYEHIMVGKHFEPKIVKKNPNDAQNNPQNDSQNDPGMYFIVL